MWTKTFEDYFLVLCVLFINFCLFGIIRSGALLYVALIETFECSHELAAWPLTLAGSSICLIGPIAGLLEKIMSIRAIVTWGVLTAAISSILCYFAYNVTIFILLIGGLYGIGTGLASTLTPILLNERFEPERRALACGIAFAGSTLGSFAWPYLIEYFIEQVNLRGAMLIYGGLILHALLGSMLLKRSKNSVPNDTALANKGTANTMDKEASKRINIGNGGRIEVRVENGLDSCMEAKLAVVMVSSQAAVKKANGIPLITKDAYDRKDLNAGANSVVRIKQPSLIRRFFSEAQREISILADPYFQLVTVSSVCFLFVYVTVFIIITDYAMDNGISYGNAMHLITIFSIADLLVKPVPGWLTCKNILTNRDIMIIGVASMGAICFILPHTTSYIGFSVISFLYGLLTGGLVFLTPILITEFLPIERAPIAVGLSNFFVGITGFLRPAFIEGSFSETSNVTDHERRTKTVPLRLLFAEGKWKMFNNRQLPQEQQLNVYPRRRSFEPNF
ncbi:monocarboxylate transporter 12-B-like isoform X2 [Varroa jacobsoni]|uniref:monocarboxylate transporter 12-B-like isoform X2 n=1 Tax=Varroa jacobsoni TaxID=62625 RepID=UPI000BF6F39A|nr:monocarboxylate transporter 12-B-like isoform X2 [Varroa jacobsoni]